MSVLSWFGGLGRRRRRMVKRRVLNSVADAIAVCDVNFRISFANYPLEELLKVSLDELEGANPLAFVHPDDQHFVVSEFARCLESSAGVSQAVVRLVDREGGIHHVQALAVNRLSDRDIGGVVVTIRDLSATMKAAEIARLHEAECRELIEDAADAIISATLDGTIVMVNDKVCELTRYSREELVGRKTAFLTLPDDQATSAATLQRLGRGETVFMQRRLLRKDGSVLPVDFHGRRHGSGRIHGILRDTTIRLAGEERERKAVRLEALGLITAGIGHDFNNVLTVIGANAEYVAGTLAPGSPESDAMHDLREEAKRGAILVRRLIRGSGADTLDIKPLCLRDWALKFERSTRHLLPAHIAVTFAVGGDIPLVLADFAAIDECFLNLLTNARDAMPDGGAVAVTLAHARVGTHTSELQIAAAAGEYVQVTVRDTGVGMDAETMHRVFEPYFTTKGNRGGTGLGLSMVYRLMKEQRGFVSVESRVGEGTAISLHLPVAPDQSEPALATA